MLEAIYYPGRYVVEGYPNQMASYAGQLNYGDVRAVIEYVKSITDGYDESKILTEWPEDYDGTEWVDDQGQLAEPPVQ